ncbi:prepilin-type N-terminal cleavage/methylation domain-containing protein [Candidatus Saccharibacteria bacterium]|nr:prepilin-type N-terminal cleavage/methylation domain-containing protein [Candidatus Saccharibacteria bacterium]
MTKNKQRGFTIIEVALVLAVAALIFLVVFLAVPALQRNQREDARKRDITIVVEAVVNITGNTNKAPTTGVAYPKPTTGGSNLKDYLGNLSNNTDYVEVVKGGDDALEFPPSQAVNPGATDSTAGANPNINRIVVILGHRCNGNTGTQVGTTRSAAVAVQLESGGAGKYYCEDAH